MKIQTISNYLPQVRLATREEFTTNLKRIAIPAITLLSIAAVEGASAIPMAECVENCDKHRDAHALMKLFCYTLCALFGK